MKNLAAIFMLLWSTTYAQLTLDDARAATRDSNLGSYSYHEEFIGKAGFGAPRILTPDGGAAIFGDFEDDGGAYAVLLKLGKNGIEEWRKEIRPEFDLLESQSVVQDKKGVYYVFMLSYDNARYRGGSERIVCIDAGGNLFWDKTIGNYDPINNPIISYIRALDDGRISLRGHNCNEIPPDGEDHAARFWEGWISPAGNLTQKTGDVIDWNNPDWQKKFSPD